MSCVIGTLQRQGGRQSLLAAAQHADPRPADTWAALGPPLGLGLAGE